MIYELYQIVKNRIDTEVAEVRHIDLWNNQIDEADQHKPFHFPAVFVEMPSITQVTETEGGGKRAVLIKLHVIVKNQRDLEAGLQEIDVILQKINEALGTATQDFTTTFLRNESIPDHSQTNLCIYEETYSTMMHDNEVYQSPTQISQSFIIDGQNQ